MTLNSYAFARLARRREHKLILSLFSESLKFPSLAIQFGLVSIDLPLLFALRLLLALELIADERSGSQSENTADRRSCSWTAHGCPDDAADGGPAERSDAGALFPCRQWSRATDGGDGERRNGQKLEFPVHGSLLGLMRLEDVRNVMTRDITRSGFPSK
jgi:hypothetical protein